MPYVFNPFTGTFDWTADGVPTLTTGGVTFGGPTGAITQDTTNFNWDDATDQLSISSSATERITNGTFTGSATGWNMPAGWTYSSNSVSHSANGTGSLSQVPTLILGERFEVSFTLSAFTAGSVLVTFAGNTLGNLTTAGTYKYRVLCLNNSLGISFTPTNTARFTVDDVSTKVLSGGTINTANVTLSGTGNDGVLNIAGLNKSNYYPGTTRHAVLANTGSYTWVDFNFGGNASAHIGANSSGEISRWVSGGNGDAVYWKPTGSLLSYNSQQGFTHYGGGWFGTTVHAGGSYQPTSTLQSSGSTALKIKYITVSQALDSTATKWIVDPSTPICTGTPTYSCSHYTNETDCNARDHHGGCTWFAGYSCSAYNGDQGGCQAQPGCTYDTASCTYFGDESTCNSYSGCTWSNNPLSCGGFDQYTCENTSGCSPSFGYCTVNYDYCSNYSDGGGDGTACYAANGGGFCDYDSGTGACTGGYWFISCSGGGSCSSQGDETSCAGYSYYDGCSGSYDNYSCSGDYYTGTCSGTYGASCQGTSSCSGIDDSSNCGSEPGCTWTTAATLTLPSIPSCQDREYWIYNNSATNADVVIVPYTGQTINHTSSYTLSNFKDRVHIAAKYVTASCSSISEGSCSSVTGCTPSYPNCSWDGANYICTGGTGCDAYGDQASCEAATYYAGCVGNYDVFNNWFVFSS